MFNLGVAVWIGYIAVAIAVWAMLLIFRDKKKEPVTLIIRGKIPVVKEEGETIVPVPRFCKYCGKQIRNDRWFCCLDHKKKYLRRKK